MTQTHPENASRAVVSCPRRKCSLRSYQIAVSVGFEVLTWSLEIALPEMKRDLIKRALLPLLGFREPECLSLGIMIRALSAKIFQAANFNELVHELHSLVSPSNGASIADSTRLDPFRFAACKELIFRFGHHHRSAASFWHTSARTIRRGARREQLNASQSISGLSDRICAK